MKINFTYSMSNEEEHINEAYQGSLLSFGDQFNLSVAGQQIISNGKNIWTYIPEVQEVQVNVASSEANIYNPITLLNTYEEQYDASLLKKYQENDREFAVILLKAKKEGPFDKAHLIINTTKHEIHAVKIFDEMGTVYSYKINELIPNIGLKGHEFTFKQEDHPEVDFIDMR